MSDMNSQQLDTEIERVERKLEQAQQENSVWSKNSLNKSSNKETSAIMVQSLKKQLADLIEQKRKLNP